VVRINISIPGALDSSIREAEITKVLKVAHHVVIAKEIKRGTRLRLGELTGQNLSPVEALKRYLETKKVNEERKKVLLEFGEKLICQSEN